jgi:hypothetical protein
MATSKNRTLTMDKSDSIDYSNPFNKSESGQAGVSCAQLPKQKDGTPAILARPKLRIAGFLSAR